MDLSPSQIEDKIKDKSLRLVTYDKNAPCLIRYFREMPPQRRLKVLEFANESALSVFNAIRAYWETHKLPPKLEILARSLGVSTNYVYLHCNMLRDIELLRALKGPGGHRDICPYDCDNPRDPIYLLHLWAKEFPQHPLAKPSRNLYEGKRKKREIPEQP